MSLEPSTLSVLGRFPTRHGGDLRTHTDIALLSQIEIPSAGVRYFNELPLELKVSNGRNFKNLLKKFLIKNEYFFPFRNSCLPEGQAGTFVGYVAIDFPLNNKLL